MQCQRFQPVRKFGSMLKEILLSGIGKMGFPTFQSISFVNQIMETDKEYLEN